MQINTFQPRPVQRTQQRTVNFGSRLDSEFPTTYLRKSVKRYIDVIDNSRRSLAEEMEKFERIEKRERLKDQSPRTREDYGDFGPSAPDSIF